MIKPSLSPLQQRDRFAFAMLDLIHRAPTRIFVGTPAQESRAVSKPAAGKVIVCNFDDHFGRDRFPFAASFCDPATRASGRIASESRWFSQQFKFSC